MVTEADSKSKGRLLICALGGQIMPAVLSASSFRPDEVWAVSSMKSSGLLSRLQHALQLLPNPPRRKPKTILVDPYDIGSVLTTVDKELNAAPNYEVLVDVTGGTKPMSFGLLLLARKRILASHYVAMERGNCGMFLVGIANPPLNKTPVDFRIPLRAYLAAYGFRVLPKPVRIIQDLSLDVLIDDLTLTDTHLSSFRKCNPMGQVLGSSRHGYALRGLDPSANAFICQLARTGVGEVKDEKWYLNSSEHKLVNGFWVESYVYRELEKLKEDGFVDEVLPGSALHWASSVKGSKTWREIDALAIRKGRLAVFSCKQLTEASWKKKRKEIFDNLEGTRNDLGRYVALFLVSVLKLKEDTVTDARERGITVMHSNGLKAFQETVRAVFSSPRPSL